LNSWEGKKKEDCFGTEIVGKVVGVGKNVGHCKKDQIVGVHRVSSE
jgi:D-arabinose 1-dehydrogenase-like Zn-dependent alcohol dehydrogenase